MGTHRVSLTIVIEMHGKKKKAESDINYSENIGRDYGEWIQDTIDEIKADAQVKDYERELKAERKRAIEKEKAEYKRLKERYG